ncbi:Ig-like domain-containing protein [Bdellovibrio svalbardensis]|uniref:Ig-like domain-containing protein n=1 Tax=Bdellovibrio svalbardensis TaxID=2972972 RepID=A0ABT6DP67_9BACT|nr:Ig-like domain-containing protein [Bdellovibrio svalbardensis]MDG0816933.1 Ig-like domain-containing protein [Bdellovibrio svalbardensis]
MKKIGKLVSSSHWVLVSIFFVATVCHSQHSEQLLNQKDNAVLTLALGGGTDGGTNGGTPGVLASALGDQRTLVIMANFQEDSTSQPITADQARSLIFGQVSGFFYEASYQQTKLVGDVYGWYTLPLSNAVCDLSAAGKAADQIAISKGVNLSSYTRIVYLFTKTPCNVSGMGTVGDVPSRAYINGSGAFTADNISHEMGHNFGLYHSHALDCGGVTIGTSCSSIEYGDSYDTMGNPDFGHFSAFQKERLGWLNYNVSPAIISATANGSYSVSVFETMSSGAKALKIPRGINPLTGNQTWFYVEYRQAVGYDSFLSKRSYRLYRQEVTNGVVIRLGEDNSPNSSQLLHMHMDSPFYATYGYADWFDPALPIGKSFTDPVSGLTITADKADGLLATVSVKFGSASGNDPVPKPNQAPVANADNVLIQKIAPVVISVLANDFDPDAEVISVSSFTQGAKGKVILNADGTLTYSPAKGFKGSDSFSYTITDGRLTATATVTISLQSSPSGGGRK